VGGAGAGGVRHRSSTWPAEARPALHEKVLSHGGALLRW
jgi:hypothetical protein